MLQVVIGEGHTLEAHERVSLCKQLPTQATQSDDELEYAAEETDRGTSPHRIATGHSQFVDGHDTAVIKLPVGF